MFSASVHYAYDQISEVHPGDFHVNIHRARSIAASLANFGRVPLKQVVLAERWKLSNVFTENYLRSLAYFAENFCMVWGRLWFLIPTSVYQTRSSIFF